MKLINDFILLEKSDESFGDASYTVIQSAVEAVKIGDKVGILDIVVEVKEGIIVTEDQIYTIYV